MPGPGAVFDMDGLLVDTEPLWREVEVELLAPLGVPIGVEDCVVTKGMSVLDAVSWWHARYPWRGPSVAAVAASVAERVRELVGAAAVLQPGALHALETCRSSGCRLALASGSDRRMIEVVLGRVGLSDAFEVVCSATEEPYGKPHPAVFLTAARGLGVPPSRCVVWEDAPNGVIAAKAARMRVVAVPEEAERGHPAFGIADVVLRSLEEVDVELLERLALTGSTGSEGFTGSESLRRQLGR